MCSLLFLAGVFTKRTNSHLVVESGKSNMGSVGARCNLLLLGRNQPWAWFSGESGRSNAGEIEAQILG